MEVFCRVEMLGPLRVVQPHQTLTRFGTQKAGMLLAYLALRAGHASPREQLIDLFWDDMDLPAGRDNLSTTLSALRRLLEPPGVPRGGVLIADRVQVSLNPAVVATDVAEFERLLEQARKTEETRSRADLRAQAIALYRGEFLPGCYLDWAVRESERLQSRYIEALSAWAQDQEQAGDANGALDAARRWTGADPYSEEAQDTLIRLLVQTGRPDAAREAYRKLERMLRDEFGTSPSPATRGRVEELMLPPSVVRSAAKRAVVPTAPVDSPQDERAATAPSATSGVPHLAALPASFSRFFGREAELALLARFLPAGGASPGPAEERARLVTLSGPGGMGKTRLATEFAREAAGRAGLWAGFVPLADVRAAEFLLPHLAHALNLPPAPGTPPLDQIAAFFAAMERGGGNASPALLVLDNLEQIAGAADAIRALLERVPNLTCLCTSRRRLGLRGERLIPLTPLPVPDHAALPEHAPARRGEPDPADLLVYPSVRLYVDRAQAVRPDFQITPGNAAAIAGLCLALEGSPLALELAASWVRSLPPRTMWERLARDLGGEMRTLEARYDDLPPRHRSLWAALDWSFRLLTPAQQRLFARLSVFRGGWTLDACEAVCDEPEALRLLAELEEASLVRSAETGEGAARWHVLETVRQHAGERLRAQGDAELAAGRHLDEFLVLAERARAELDGQAQTRWLDTLEAEHDNLRAALDHSANSPDARERGLRLAAALLPFWRARGYLTEGQKRTAALLALPGAERRDAARAAALNGAGILAMLQSEYAAAEACHEEARAIFQDLCHIGGVADALQGLGNARFYSQDYPAARRFFEKTLTLRQQADDVGGLAAAYHCLGGLALREKRYAEAASCYENALRLRRGQGGSLAAAASLGGLGQLAIAQEDYGKAIPLIREALRLFAEAGQRWTVALCLGDLSRIAEAQGRWERAVRLFGAATALRERFHFRVPPAERAEHETRIADLRARMGEAAFAAAWDTGYTLSWEDAIADALGE